MTFPTTVLLGSVLLLLASCGGAPDEALRPSADAGASRSDAGTSTAAVRFDRIYREVFHEGVQCTGCHDFLGAELSEDALYGTLVNAASTRDPCEGQIRVVPGDLEASVLWRKVAPEVSVCGEKMPMSVPLFGPPLTAEQRDLLRKWIEGGATR